MTLIDVIRDIVVAFGAGGTTWFFARRKNNAEASSAELENIEKAITIWREQAEKLSEQVQKLEGEIAKLKHDNEKLHEEIRVLRSSVDDSDGLPS